MLKYPPAIVIAAYNRTHCLKRLLQSVVKATYPSGISIPLIISLDKSENEEVLALANAFEWTNGPKRIITHKKHLGLKAHILSCGDLTQEYGSIILLEDDLWVGKYYYDFACAGLAAYEQHPEIAGISLYSYQMAESRFAPFVPVEDELGVYFMQIPSSWGQTWSAKQWEAFRQWFKKHPEIEQEELLPSYVRRWSEHSWKKHFMRYLIQTNRYFVYPRASHSTNFHDKGTHSQAEALFQVPLSHQDTYGKLGSVAQSLAIYDAYFELMPNCLNKLIDNLLPYEYSIDLYGVKDIEFLQTEYVLTTRLGKNPILSFGLEMVPMLNNVLFEVEGNEIRLIRTKDLSLDSRPPHFYYYRTQSIAPHIYHEMTLQTVAETTERVIYETNHPPIAVVSVLTNPPKDWAFVDEVLSQSYPRIEYIIVCLFEEDMEGRPPPQKGYKSLQYICLSPETPYSQALQQGFEAVTALVMTWFDPIHLYTKGSLSHVMNVFRRFGEVACLVGYDVESLPAEGTRIDRWNATNYFAYHQTQQVLALHPNCVFWHRNAWERIGQSLPDAPKEVLPLVIQSLFLQSLALYVTVLPLVATTHPLHTLPPLVKYQAFQSLANHPAPSSFLQKLCSLGYYRRLPILQSLYLDLNRFPNVIRYDKDSDSYYFSRY